MIEDINDKEDIRLILDYKRAMAMDKVPLPDMEEERKRFWEKQKQVRPFSHEMQQNVNIKMLRLKRWCIVASVAAVLFLGLFLGAFFYHPSVVQVQVFAADKSAVDPKLNFGDITYVIKEETPDQQLYAHGIIATRKSIDLSTKKAATLPIEEQLQTLTTPCGQDYTVTLSDGTTVLLNAASQLIFPDVFVKEQRIVYLKGEAYFDVAPDKEHPFIVKTDYFETVVLGTKFNVRSYSKLDAHVTLLEGKVTVANDMAPALTLQPEEQVSLTEDGMLRKQAVDIYPYLEWQNGYFYFDNVSLVEIMQELGRWYNVDVVFENDEMIDYKMHFVASRTESLMYAVRNLNALGIFYVTLDGNRIIIQ
ncbi:FecR family protein [Bacteroides congonensis]|uniref:FecR family protein n=1 Tax=Bacteroides congonensis TaxID=1871006 RepID=UPI00189EDD72|nr:FecR family protein [Bacteroides congonensis]